MSWYSEPQDKVKIGFIQQVPSTRMREPYQTDPVVNANYYHHVNAGNDTQLNFSYEANSPVSIMLTYNNKITDNRHNQPSGGQVPVPIYNASYSNHNGSFAITVTDSKRRSSTASTQLYVH